jgi:hypothetical protein
VVAQNKTSKVAQNKTSKKGQGSEPSRSALISLLDAFLVAGEGLEPPTPGL